MESLVLVTQVSLLWVIWNHLQVAVLDEVVQRLRRLLLVHGVGVDGGAHDVEVFLENSLAGMLDGAHITGDRQRCEYPNDGHDDHQLDEREAFVLFPNTAHRFLLRPNRLAYQVEYLVPSRAVPCDFEYTSKTL